jgi:tRNA(adenine34) deaminase
MINTQQNSFTPDDHRYMAMARQLAARSLHNEEVPVGALIVSSEGTIIGHGYNQIEKKQSQLGHAEIQAINQATKKINGWRLDNHTLYVTLEPCMMCLGASLLSRVKKIVYGAPSNLFGISSSIDLMPPVYRSHTIILQGLQQDECSDMLKHFFSKIRSKKETTREQECAIHQHNERKLT